MNKRIKRLALLACLLLPHVAHSRVTGWISVLQIGGQVNNVYVVLSETVGDDLGCPHTRLVLQEGTFDTDARKRFYAAMVTAMTTGAKVQLAVSGCTGAYPSLISTDYWFVKPN